MRTKLVKRYYCDFCSYGRLTRQSMIRHEGVCFRNTARVCACCEGSHDMPELVKLLKDGGLKELRDKVDGCPGCIMATIVQSRKRGKFSEDDEYYPDFDYKKELKDWRDEQRPAFDY